ncbi:MAG: MFS transporter [Alphaproteobacteria bacterium]
MAKLSFDILRNKNFRILLATRTLALTAMQAQAVIVGWQVYDITGSTLMLGLTGLAEAIPAITCALFAGHFVDTSHPRRVYSLCLAGLAINTLLLFILAGGIVALDDTWLLVAIFGGIIASGFIRSFIMPATFTLLPRIVPREKYSAATSWQTAGHQIAFIGGPALGGLIYGGYGVGMAWFFALIVMFIAVILTFAIKVDYKKRPPEEIRPPAFKSIKEGWVFLLHNRALLSIMSLDMLAVLFGGAIAILPAFADQVLGVGAEGLGLLRAAPALGAILTALWFAVFPMQHITAIKMLVVVAGFGASMIGFGLSTSFLWAVIFLSLSGAFDSVSMVIRGTMTQILTPEHMKGRVSAVNSMFIISSNEIGAFQSGLFASIFGLVPSIIIGGSGTLAVVGLIAWISPAFRKLNMKT